jgi:hypothetical protein
MNSEIFPILAYVSFLLFLAYLSSIKHGNEQADHQNRAKNTPKPEKGISFGKDSKNQTKTSEAESST